MTVADLDRPPAAPAGSSPAPPGSGGPSRLDRWRATARERLWPTVLLLAVVATTTVLTSAPGRLVGDNRLEVFVNPARRVARSLVLWDGSRGLGRVREDFWPATTLGPALLRGLGASPALAAHLWHAALLTFGGVGVVLVVRLFRPRIGVEHVAAGLLAMFGPFSAAFLLPTNLSYQAALAPWLVVVTYRGVHSSRPWRWAAAFALLVFSAGNADLPGLAYNLVPLVPLLAYVLVVERSARVRDVIGWGVRAGVLALWVSAAMLFKTYVAAAALGQRLNDTEPAESAARASSWAESFRQLGSWLTYFPDGQGLLKPQGEVFLTNSLVILATFVPPILALVLVARSRWAPRILFAAMALTSLVVMVGAYPLDDQAPIGRLILQLLEDVASLAAFRNTYKIGAGLVIGVSVLAGMAVAGGFDWVRDRRPRFVPLVGVAAVAVLAAVSVPFWTGGLYDERRTFDDVPAYWTDALTWLDDQPGGERVLVLPQGSRLGYRWGWVGDDIFDSLLAREHAIATGVPLSTAAGASMIEALSQTTHDPAYVAGSLAPVARRLGIDTVVLRNDVDWVELGQPRPAAFQGFRNDPDWVRVAAFGQPGENTTNPVDRTADAQYERTLAPVEVYALRAETGVIRLAATGAATVVSGDGYAWPQMAAAGLLEDDRPVVPSGALDDAQLQQALEDGGPVVVTDTNRRRLRFVLSYESDYSHTLAAGEDLDRPTQSIYPADASQSVAWFPDATRIAATGPPRSTDGSRPWERPAMAFDGNPLTAWQVRRVEAPLGRRLRVDLRAPTVLDRMLINPTRALGEPTAQAVRLHFSDGSSTDVDLRGGETEATFEPRQASWFEIELVTMAPEAQVVGLSDVTVPGLDLREFVQVPEDVFRRGDADPAVGALLDEAPFTYLFERVQTINNPDEESAVRRRFRTSGTRSMQLAGSFQARATTNDASLNALVGGPVTASSFRRLDADLAGWAGYAVDGDTTTGWQAPPVAGNPLTIQGPARIVDQVRVISRSIPGYSPIRALEVRVGDQVVQARTELTPGCAPDDLAGGCFYEAVVPIDPVNASRIVVVPTEIDGPDASLGGKVRIDEVQVNGQPNPVRTDLDEPFDGCRDLGITVETSPGAFEDVPVQLVGTPAQVLAGESLPFEACSPVTMADGWHLLQVEDNAPVAAVSLATTEPAPPTTPVPTAVLTPTAADPTSYRVEADVDGAAFVILAQSFDPRWRATADGRDLGRSVPYDSLNGWRVEGDGPVVIELRYPPQRSYRVALGITAAGVVLCAWLLLRRRPERDDA